MKTVVPSTTSDRPTALHPPATSEQLTATDRPTPSDQPTALHQPAPTYQPAPAHQPNGTRRPVRSPAAPGLPGREVQCRLLDRLLAAPAAPVARAVLITGEPGIGKSRLLAELAHRARAYGYRVLDAGRPSAEERTGTRGTGAAGVRGTGSGGGGVGGRALARIEEFAANCPAPGAVVLLDDAQWADARTAALLERVLRCPPRVPVLLAVAYRPRQVPRGLRAAIGAAAARGTVAARIALGPLEGEASAVAVVGDGRTSAELRALLRESGGNPLYLRALAHVGGEEGAECLDAAVAGELARVPAVARQVARAAAVAGDPFGTEAAASVAGMDESTVLAAMDELVAEDILRPARAPRTFAFRHPLVREAVYRSAPPGWRALAHSRAVEDLIRRGARPEDYARHVERAARPGDLDAVRMLALAAYSARRSAPQEAIGWLRTALRLLPAGAEPLGARLRFRLARLLGAAGRLHESRDLLHSLLDVLPGEPADRHAEAVAACALAEWSLGRRAEARALIAAELSRQPVKATPAAARLAISLARVCLAEARPARCAHWARQALTEAQRYEHRPLRAAGHGLSALAAVLEADPGPARTHCEAAATLLDGLPDGEVEHCPEAVVWTGWSELLLGRHQDAARHLDRGIAVTRASGQRLALPHLLTARAFSLQAYGRLGEAAEAAARAAELADGSDAEEARLPAQAVAALTAARAGDTEAALRGAASLMERCPPGTGEWPGTTAARVLAEARLASGDPDGALAAAELVGGAALPLVDVWSRVEWYEMLTRAALAVGRIDQAGNWAVRAETAAALLGLPCRTGNALLARAHVEAARRPTALATATATAAREALREAGQFLDAHRARQVAATARASYGETRQALSELSSVQAEFTACGAQLLARDAAAARRRIAAPSAARPPRQALAGELAVLTRPQHEIAEGLSKSGALPIPARGAGLCR